MAVDNRFTITYDEGVKGFTSFHSYQPDWMGSFNNNFYSVKDGQLYKHNDGSGRNNFYGSQYNSTIKLIVNEAPSDIKVLKTINIEGNKAVDMVITAYLSDDNSNEIRTSLSAADFEDKEGKFHAYLRRNETATDLSSKSTYGVGTVNSAASGGGSTVVTLTGDVPTSLISIGDSLYDGASVLLGVITAVSTTSVTINTVVAIAGATFVYGVKDARIEGSSIRGYNFEIDITDQTTNRTEIFAINSNVFKSEPS